MVGESVRVQEHSVTYPRSFCVAGSRDPETNLLILNLSCSLVPPKGRFSMGLIQV